ncbi:tRNA (adenine(22)-N(1))-methyltransferase [Oribacterium sp. WCC10]|uniref:tRNA (adenine(22)-N(1))-methyltransferase n=1 Tax=Oribacterium sp. WCC10 TaxID=1855343 RepID=UPI0008F185B7|nr:class I SAM-dependent methyltransferase [Oribacterium sp. WCC10]SFG41546.1 tRNA (adenine22-N1)-methyltransferase [Oribacterium sp. WCC10]
MNLPYRLKKITELVPPSDTVADIGCDHAYVAIELVKSGKAKHALACDVNEGPLKSAGQNVLSEGLTDKVELRLSDGLARVKAHEADTVIIAGMGGLLMERILTGHLKDFDTFVLSPQSDIEHFRHFLIDNGMKIVSENMLIDDKKYYTILTVSANILSDSESTNDYYKNDEDFIYGGLLLKEKDETLLSFLQKEKLRYENILSKTQNDELKKSYEICKRAIEKHYQ